MADKDLKERATIKECIPQCSLLICLFHVMRTFKCEVTSDKMGISSGQRISCLELLQKLAYASSELHYNEIYFQFVRDVPQTVVKYYNEKWHSIRMEWVLCIKFVAGSFNCLKSLMKWQAKTSHKSLSQIYLLQLHPSEQNETIKQLLLYQ